MSVWFSLILDITQFAREGCEREAFFSFRKPGQGYIKPLFSSTVYTDQHTLIIFHKKGVEGKVCSQNSPKKKIQLIGQQQRNNSFSLRKVNANNNSHDSGNKIMLQRVTFSSWLSPFPPCPKDIFPSNRTKWFILAHVSCWGLQDHTVWLVGQVCLLLAVITKEAHFIFLKRNTKWYVSY